VIVVILLFGVLFLFVRESKECALAVCRTIATQTHATRFRHCCFPSKKPGCTARRSMSAEPIADWSDLGQLTFVSYPVYVSLVLGQIYKCRPCSLRTWRPYINSPSPSAVYQCHM